MDPAGPARAPLRGLPLVEQTVPALLARQADRHGDREFVRACGAGRSYAQMRDAAASVALLLTQHGVQRHDRVAMLCGNRLELIELILGCAWAGALAVPINVALRGAQLEHVLANCAPRILVVEAGQAHALELVELPPGIERVWWVGDPPGAPGRYGAVPLPAFRAVDTGAAAAGAADPGDTFVILYTSGTTGRAKGVCCPHAQMYWWGVINSEVLSISEHDVLFTTLPLFHTNAINSLFQCLVAGATYVIEPRFSASRHWELARDHGATVTYLLGAMVGMLMAQPARLQDRAHRVRVALAPATPASMHQPFRERFGVLLVDGYGSTETSHIIGRPGDEQRPGYLGRAVEEFDVAVVDEHDAAVPDGVPGELVVRAHHPFMLASGYEGMAEVTLAAWRNLWFHTGDRVVREPGGWIQFLDRRADMIRRRGENISSFEVEEALLTHRGVEAAAVFGVPSDLAEDEVMAVIVPAAGTGVQPHELVAWCEPRIAYFAIPRYIEFADELPLTENGKVRKEALRARGVTDGTWDRERAGVRVRR